MELQITDKVIFDDSKKIQEQTPEFQALFTDNCPINDKTPVTELDEYDRPARYDFTLEELHITVHPNYIYQDRSSWAISGYTISIN